MMNFWFLKIIRFLHPRYHPKKIGDILKNGPKSKSISFNKVVINDNENEAEIEK